VKGSYYLEHNAAGLWKSMCPGSPEFLG
jgi:hypothetical protein